MNDKKRQRSYQRARVLLFVHTLVGSFCCLFCFFFYFIFVSLSMIFQASRFSASGRRVPLEPRRSEACRSCQPMHVLSFGEGRSVRVFCFPVRVRQPAFGKCEPASWWSLGLNINLVIICFTLRLRGRRGLLFLEWRFDKFFVVLDHFPRSKPQEGYFPIGG